MLPYIILLYEALVRIASHIALIITLGRQTKRKRYYDQLLLGNQVPLSNQRNSSEYLLSDGRSTKFAQLTI